MVSIAAFGAFVEIAPGRQGLLHISEVAHEPVDNVESVLSVGDKIDVVVLAVTGDKLKLSRKAALGQSIDVSNKSRRPLRVAQKTRLK